MVRTSHIRYFANILMLIIIVNYAYTQNHYKEDPELGDLIYQYATKGFNYLQVNNNLDSAEFYLLKSLDLQYYTNNYKMDYRVANTHIILASF